IYRHVVQLRIKIWRHLAGAEGLDRFKLPLGSVEFPGARRFLDDPLKPCLWQVEEAVSGLHPFDDSIGHAKRRIGIGCEEAVALAQHRFGVTLPRSVLSPSSGELPAAGKVRRPVRAWSPSLQPGPLWTCRGVPAGHLSGRAWCRP